MALEVSFTRTLRGLEPLDEEAREALKTWKIGAIIKGTFATTRENPHRRYFYGMVQLVMDNTELFKSKEACVDSIKLSVDLVDQTQEYRNGEWSITRTPKSIAGKSLNEVEWRDFNARVERLICQVLSVSEEQLAEAMEQWIAPGYRR